MPSTTPLDPMARMRAHKGNAPSLPQTKYCSLCPAKFTRTTHLNRHLRSRMVTHFAIRDPRVLTEEFQTTTTDCTDAT
jgi:hypothetical protein